MGERQQQDNVVGDGGRVTISEAATLLGVHRNTIKNRMDKGMYSAEKVHTERGPTWMIDRNSLQTNTPSRATQPTSVGVPDEFVQQLAREIVREAGITRGPEKEAVREGLKAQVETFRHLNTISGATAVAVLIVQANLDPPIIATVITLIMIALSFGVSGYGTLTIGWLLSDPSSYPDNRVLNRVKWMHMWGFSLICVAIGSLIFSTLFLTFPQ
jgi:hypothetical protein